MNRLSRTMLLFVLAAAPVLAEDPAASLPPGLGSPLSPALESPVPTATLGTCRVTCRLIGGTFADLVRYQWQTTYALCCDPAIQPCDAGYAAFGLSFNSTKCSWI